MSVSTGGGGGGSLPTHFSYGVKGIGLYCRVERRAFCFAFPSARSCGKIEVVTVVTCVYIESLSSLHISKVSSPWRSYYA